jgi:hypothetical protein
MEVEVLTYEEMNLVMIEDAKAGESAVSKQVVLNTTQDEIYQQALSDGYLDVGIPGVALDKDTNIVVDYLAQHNTIELQMYDNNIYIENEYRDAETVEEHDSTVRYIIKEI